MFHYTNVSNSSHSLFPVSLPVSKLISWHRAGGVFLFWKDLMHAGRALHIHTHLHTLTHTYTHTAQRCHI